ncbi:MAG TPA: hypothetical protein VI603_04060 [Saprospiraceae bacterium]|nr:hypothetical protein [Saprospiraceae bacterium]
MNDSVSETADSVPINVIVSLLEIIGKSIRCFADNLKISDNRIYRFTILAEVIKSQAIGILENFGTTVNNVLYQKIR